jgi:hypothetical protein
MWIIIIAGIFSLAFILYLIKDIRTVNCPICGIKASSKDNKFVCDYCGCEFTIDIIEFDDIDEDEFYPKPPTMEDLKEDKND